MEKILSGVRVLDFTDALAGPYCTRYLADCGAEVLNIEKPGGKVARGIPYVHKGVSVDYIYNHCGKKSVGIDMKKKGARELILQLAKTADVVVENFRPGVMAEFSLTYADFETVNPSVIMCSISGWGQEGPYAERMGADLSIQAISGILNLTGDPGKRPALVGFPVTDILAGLNAFGAICAALFRRAKTGQGEYIDIGMADCAIACLHQAVGVHTLTQGAAKVQRAGSFNNDMPSWGVFKGTDGYIVISAATKIGWDRLCDLMGKPELAQDPRFSTREARLKHNDDVVKVIEEWLATFDKVAEVATLLQTYRIQAAPVLSVADIIDEDPQFKVRGMLKEIEHPILGKMQFLNSPLKFSNAKASVDEPPSAVAGEHTDQVLHGLLNLSDDEIALLRKEGIIFSGQEKGKTGKEAS
jgi:crotonobetainyl-CoA:carnitine CoA-transferase CaiB-like acyl-CoA transferase